MYIVEVSNKTGTAERRFRTEEGASRLASKAANDGYVYINNPELNKEQRRFEVEHVRIYDQKNPDVDIDF